eukprot:GCRY01002581.1.p1 GENE.GCRY01002581.1~~GCRY01002581.1.p1  ORF type:complete len:421 (+),score=92.25 GCRY01002581.1:157-1419(+)
MSGIKRKKFEKNAQNMTLSRIDLAASEYLLRQKELRNWLSVVMDDEDLPEDLHLALSDGVFLCRLCNKLIPDSVPKFNESIPKNVASSHYKLENIAFFLEFAQKKLGLGSVMLFASVDLFEKKNMFQVLNCIHHFAIKAHHMGLAVPLSILKHEDADFTREQLQECGKELREMNVDIDQLIQLSNERHLETFQEKDEPSELDKLLLAEQNPESADNDLSKGDGLEGNDKENSEEQNDEEEKEENGEKEELSKKVDKGEEEAKPTAPKIEEILSIEVLDPVKEGKGLSAHTVYKVVTTTNDQEFVVRRRFKEFQWLRDRLIATDAGIPEMPAKSFTKRFKENFVQERREKLEDLVNYCVWSVKTRFSRALKDFLRDEIVQLIRSKWRGYKDVYARDAEEEEETEENTENGGEEAKEKESTE